MAKIAITTSPRIAKNGGPITSDVYKSHATNLWEKNALLKLSSGLLTPVVDTNAASAEIDTDDTGTGVRLFLALEDHLTAGTEYVAVQEILADTIIELQLLNAGAGDCAASDVAKGTSYTGYQIDNGTMHGSGLWGIDVNDTTNPVFNIVDIQTDYEPYTADADYNKVYVKVLSSILA